MLLISQLFRRGVGLLLFINCPGYRLYLKDLRNTKRQNPRTVDLEITDVVDFECREGEEEVTVGVKRGYFAVTCGG